MRLWRIVAASCGVTAAVALGLACGAYDAMETPAGADDAGAGDGPESSVADDAMSADVAAGGDAGGDADAAIRHCATVSKPLAPTEFFCADFDGTDAAEGWSSVLSVDGGVLALTTTVATSPPQALLARSQSGAASGAGPEVDWRSAGAKAFTRASIRAHVSPLSPSGIVPSYNGGVTLLSVVSTNASAALRYSRGGAPPSGDSGSTVGYFVEATTFGGAESIARFAVEPILPNDAWTDVTLTWDAASGGIKLTYNGLMVLNAIGFASTSTTVTFGVGANASGNITLPDDFRFDDVELTLERQ